MGNLLINSNNNLLISDFGLSCSIDDNFEIVGTPNYLSPELVDGKLNSFESDIWAVGVVLYFLFYGVAPFQHLSGSMKKLYSNIQKVNYSFPDNNNGQDLIKKIFKKNPEDRISLLDMENHPFLLD